MAGVTPLPLPLLLAPAPAGCAAGAGGAAARPAKKADSWAMLSSKVGHWRRLGRSQRGSEVWFTRFP